MGANTSPPKNPSNPPKKGMAMATTIVNAEENGQESNKNSQTVLFQKDLKEDELCMLCFVTTKVLAGALPTYRLLVIKRRAKLGAKRSFFTSTVSSMSNIGIA